MNHILVWMYQPFVFWLPEPDYTFYHKMAFEHYLRSKVLPYIPGC